MKNCITKSLSYQEVIKKSMEGHDVTKNDTVSDTDILLLNKVKNDQNYQN